MPKDHSTLARPLLLVHGAWHGAWCWSALQAELDRRGLPSHAIDLPGHGSSLAPFGGLYDDAKHVRATLDRLGIASRSQDSGGAKTTQGYADEGFVLVGHSYGGAVITEAAVEENGGARSDIARLVYVAAFALDQGESVVTALQAFPQEGDLLRQAVQPQEDASTLFDPDFAHQVLYGECTPEETAAAIRRLCPQPGATMTEPISGNPRDAISSTYVQCLRDRAVPPVQQASMASRCTESVELDTDHSPFMSQTAALADILEQIATRPPGS